MNKIRALTRLLNAAQALWEDRQGLPDVVHFNVTKNGRILWLVDSYGADGYVWFAEGGVVEVTIYGGKRT